MKAIGRREWMRCELRGVAAKQIGSPRNPPQEFKGQQVEAWLSGWDKEDAARRRR